MSPLINFSDLKIEIRNLILLLKPLRWYEFKDLIIVLIHCFLFYDLNDEYAFYSVLAQF